MALRRAFLGDFEVDGNIAITADGKLVWEEATSVAKYLLEMRVAGDVNPRFRIRADGRLELGVGIGGMDCILQRRASNILNTPDRMEVGTLGVGNSAAATTLGSVTKKIEVFDAAGNSLGYLPVYDAIT